MSSGFTELERAKLKVISSQTGLDHFIDKIFLMFHNRAHFYKQSSISRTLGVCVCGGGSPSFKQHWSWLTAVPRWDGEWGLRMMFVHSQPPTCPHSHSDVCTHTDMPTETASVCLQCPCLSSCTHSYRQPVCLQNNHSCALSSKNSCLYPSEHKTQVRGPCVSSHSVNSKTQCLEFFIWKFPIDPLRMLDSAMDDKSKAKPTESLDVIHLYPGLFGGTAKDTAVMGTFSGENK